MTRARKGRTAKKGKSHAAWRLSPGAWRATWATIGWLTALGLLVVGVRHLEQQVRAATADVDCRLSWAHLPAWLRNPEHTWILTGDATYPGIEADADLRPDDSIHDPHLCERVGRGLRANPWIRDVQRVTKFLDGTIEVAADFREPCAFVAARGRAYLVDTEGVRLPLEKWADYRLETDPLLIKGVRAPLPRAGELWAGDDPNAAAPELVAGLKLVRFLQQAQAAGRLPFRTSLRAVDVAGASGVATPAESTLLRIETVYPGCHVDWGLPPGDEYQVDSATAERKLQLLNTAYAEHGRLPDKIIVVRWAENYELRPPGRR